MIKPECSLWRASKWLPDWLVLVVSSKGLFLQTQPLNTSKWGTSGPWPPAQLHQQQWPVQNLVPLIKQGTMVFYHVWPVGNTTPLHFLSPNNITPSQSGTVNTLTPPPTPHPLHQLKGMPLNGCWSGQSTNGVCVLGRICVRDVTVVLSDNFLTIVFGLTQQDLTNIMGWSSN